MGAVCRIRGKRISALTLTIQQQYIILSLVLLQRGAIMAKRKSFADDGWAIWVTGEDTSTFYLNEWVNPQGKSYVDVSVRIRGVKGTHSLNDRPLLVKRGPLARR